MTLDTGKLKESAEQAVQAAACASKASLRLAQAVAPAARERIAAIPARISKQAATSSGRKRLAVQAAIGLAAVAGTVATAAHLSYHARAVKSYRMLKRGAAEWESIVSGLFDEAQTIHRAQRFEELYGQDAFEDGMIASPGCFVIVSYPMDFDEETGDWYAFSDSYVGAGSSIAAAVHKQLSGKGSPYVAADLACERPVYVLSFPCELHRIYERREELIEALESELSYNRVSDVDEIE